MRLKTAIAAAVLLAALTAWTQQSGSLTNVVIQIRLDNEAITPVTARYILRAIQEAEDERAAALMLLLDTPGGLLDSTREIVKRILDSKVPVIVYVAPRGARAASAGVFITLASHAAAMAPGTTIGAAHPVSVGGIPTPSPPSQPSPPEKEPGKGKEPTTSTPMEDKILNDTVAWARSLAQLRGRNEETAERTVRESFSAPANEAVKLGLADFVAESVADLLKRLDGTEVTVRNEKRKFETANARVVRRDMWWGDKLLAAIANPNIAILLMMIGFYGILFEFYTPGWGIAGTVGVICLILGFFAMSVLPINYGGLALILVALVLFGAEAFVASHGLLTLGGVVCMLIGGLMLVDTPSGFGRVSLWVLGPLTLATAAISVFLVANIVRSFRLRPQTGVESMSGWDAVASKDFVRDGNSYRGTVFAHGELWSAVSAGPVTSGQPLKIDGRSGLTLQVSGVEQQERGT